MALPFLFGPQPGPTIALSDLDANFAALGELVTIPCMVSGTNALTLTALPTTPTIGAYQDFLRLSGTAAATSTGAVTAAAFGLAALPVYKNTGTGPAVLAGGEIVAGNTIELVFDAALNAGNGGFHLVSAAASGGGGGGITQLTGAVLAGPGSGSQAATLATVPNNRILSNISGGVAAPLPNTLTSLLDILGTTQGGIIARGASVWSQVVETSWSPAITFGGAAIGLTYGTQAGEFYSIGFLNYAMFNLVLTSKGSSVGAAALSLPAASGSGRIGGGMIVNYSNMASLTTVPWVQIAGSGSTGSMVIAGSGTVTALADTNFNNNSALSGFVFYLTG
jgi:hypothetical protein